jgi:ElaB/YqjD/DUF883 family membrane-anchored ribosome-binding protein
MSQTHNGNGAGHTDSPDPVAAFTEAARAAADMLRETGRKATEAVSHLADDAYETGTKTRDEVAHRVVDQPLTAVLLAAGIGLLAGLLFSRR